MSDRKLRSAGLIAGLLSTILGAGVLIGWYSHDTRLIQVIPTFVPMQYNTALGFILCGIGLMTLRNNYRRVAAICGVTVAAIGLLTSMQYIFGADFGIDQLLMEHYITVEASHPGRMAPNTALCFGLCGLAFLAACRSNRLKKDYLPTELLGLIVAALGTVAFMGYLSGVETAYGWGNLTRMAVHTSSGFIVLGFGTYVLALSLRIESDRRSVIRWYASPVGIAIATLTITLWQATRAHLGPESTALPYVVLVTGLMIAVLTTVAIQLAQVSAHRARSLVSALQEKAEAQLRYERGFSESIIQSSAAFFVSIDSDSKTKMMNQAMLNALGYTADEVTGVDYVKTFVLQSDRHRVSETIAIMSARRQPSINEYRVMTKDGVELLAEWRGQAIFDDNDELDFIFGVGIDITARKRTEDALKASEQQYADLYDNSPDMYVSVDAKTARVIQCNQTLADKLGCSKDEIIGHPIFGVYHPDCMEKVKETFKTFVETGEIHDTELQLKRRDGSKIDVNLNVSCVRDKDGSVLYSRSCWIDISERKKSEEIIALQRKMSDDIINSLPGIFYLFDNENRLLRWNKMFEEVTGYSSQELLGKHATAFFDDEDKKRVADSIGEIFLKGETDVEAHLLTKQGIKIPYNLTGRRTVLKGENHFLGVGTDITESKRAEEEIALEKKISDEIINSLPGLFYLYDSQNRLVRWNKMWEQQGEYSPQELLGMKATDLVDGNDKEAVKESIRKTYSEGEGNVEAHVITKSGLRIPYYFKGVSTTLNGERHMLGVGTDLTERKKAEEALQREKARAQKYLDVTGTMLVALDADQKITLINNAGCELLGYARQDIIGRNWFDTCLPTEIVEPVKVKFDELMGSSPVSTDIASSENPVVTRDGEERLIAWYNTVLTDSDGKATGTLSSGADITDRKQVEEAMKASMKLLHMMETSSIEDIMLFGIEEGERLTNSQIAYFHWVNPDQETIWLKTWSANSLNYCSVENETMNYPIEQAGVWVDCIHQQKPVIHNNYENLPHKKGLPEGHLPIIRDLGVPVFEGGKIVAVLGVGNKPTDYTQFDIDQLNLLAKNTWSVVQRKRAEEQVRIERDFSETLIQSSPTFIVTIDSGGRILMMNQAMLEALGYTAEEVEGLEYLATFVPKDEREMLSSLFADIVEKKRPTLDENNVLSRDGRRILVEWRGRPVLKDNGDFDFFFGVGVDITERKKTETLLQKYSLEDGLTGLANRRHFDQVLDKEWHRAMREKQTLSLIMVDVDHFKKYNDMHGHQQGDECLKVIGECLKEIFRRPADLVARYGGEEFVAILPDTASDGSAQIAESVRNLVLQMKHPSMSGAKSVTISLGVATACPDVNSDPSSLLKKADQALYRAKNEGRNRTCVWSTTHHEEPVVETT